MMFPEVVRYPVHPDGMQPRIAEDDFPNGLGGRIFIKDRLDILSNAHLTPSRTRRAPCSSIALRYRAILPLSACPCSQAWRPPVILPRRPRPRIRLRVCPLPWRDGERLLQRPRIRP